MSFWKSMAFAGAVLALTGEAWAEKCPAEAFVVSAGNAFLSAARSGSPQAFTSVAGRYADLRSIALFALGPHRKLLPKGQEAQYLTLAKAYMGRFMAKHASKFSGSGLKVVSCSGNTVNASTAGGKRLVFRVAGGKGGYKVMDVNASSIWLAGQMRSTFVSVINRNHGDINALLTYLR